MMKRHLVVCVCVFVGCLLGNSARAQFSGDNQTFTISGVTTDWPTPLFVGDTNSSDQIQIINGGVLLYTNGFEANIGFDTIADNNSVVVSGNGSAWIFGPANGSLGGGIYIGHSGSTNSLIINNGAGVIGPAFSGYIAYIGYDASADNNTLVVSGSGSVWDQSTSGGMFIGYRGSGNSLIVSNGAQMFAEPETGYQLGANNNSVLITGPGSVLNNTFDWEIGFFGSSNSLVISNGGMINNQGRTLVVGFEPGSDNNHVTVTGSGSIWTNGGFFVGTSGSGNSLLIGDGGAVFSVYGFVSGAAFGSFYGSNDCVIITGSGSVWNIGNEGFELGVDGAPFGNSVVITNGGALISSFSLVTGASNSVVVTDSGSVWSNQDNLDIGISSDSGGENTLVIENGGNVFDGEGRIGTGNLGNQTSHDNNVIVAGTGSLWNNSSAFADSGALYVGDTGFGNSLVISNSGQVFDASGAIGSQPGSSSNSVRVVGDGVWENGALTVGDQGSSNSLVIDGGTVSATSLTVGLESPTCDNLVELDSGSLTVTNVTGNATLEVRNGLLILGGGVLQADVLILTNGCGRFIRTGGTLIVNNVIFDTNAFNITSIARQGNDLLITWMMGPGQTNALQATAGAANGSYATNGFTDIFVVTNNFIPGAVTNYLDVGGATNKPARYYRVRLVP
jgi:T5SS/PEP-CTERM-associated repeat protein